ncbi:hypothetical protein Py17XNL_000900270 [Plasmodium yoelii yoelii]|uniref:PYST-C1-like N-terminal domain-containing protein n=1 Tax=Plasmodium yoelii yoelii TaxID=73239 RepID=A0AAE9WQX0_PLAYO|nr:hypothetical protein Py17XNL_000900270 [Plasmodium yoelii yoelii]
MKIVVFDFVVIIIFYLQSKVQSIYNKKNTSLPLFISSERNKKIIPRKIKNKNFKTYIWGYPIYDDSPFKLRRPKIYPNFEYGELRKSQDFDYVVSTNISQNK